MLRPDGEKCGQTEVDRSRHGDVTDDPRDAETINRLRHSRFVQSVYLAVGQRVRHVSDLQSCDRPYHGHHGV